MNCKFRLDIEALRERREAFNEAARQHAMAGENVAAPVSPKITWIMLESSLLPNRWPAR